MFWLFLALTASADPAAEPPFPFQDFPPIPGRTEGVLVEIGDYPWGTPVGWTGDAHRHGPCTWLYFGSGGSPRALYFATDNPEQGENWMQDWTAGDTIAEPISASMWCSQTVNDYGLDAPIHLVELEVNRGEGSPGGLHFVVTAAKVLETSNEVPMDPGAVLTELGKRFDDAIRLEDDLTKAALKRGRALATTEADQFRLTVELPPAGGTLPGASEVVEPTPERRVHLAWDAEADRLDVRMLHEWTGHAAVRWVEAQTSNCPPGAPCREAPPQTRQQAWTWGATRTARFVVDASGKIVEEHIDPIALTGLAAL